MEIPAAAAKFMAEKTENLQKIHPALSRFLLKSRPFYGMIRIS